MLGSEVPPWRTMILEGGQLVIAPGFCAMPGAVAGFEPEGSGLEAPGVVPADGAGMQFVGTAATFFLCWVCFADVDRDELAEDFAGVEVLGGVAAGEVP